MQIFASISCEHVQEVQATLNTCTESKLARQLPVSSPIAVSRNQLNSARVETRWHTDTTSPERSARTNDNNNNNKTTDNNNKLI
jgi:hypothetical protein